jgi:hypothetical protein
MKQSIVSRTTPVALTIVLLALIFLDSCKGPEGPMGPAGPGSRKVYTGTITSAATSESGQVVSIPELNLANFPLVAVYVSDNTGTWVQLNLVVYDPSSQTFPIFEVAFLQTGSVTIISKQVGEPYRIVVVY